MWTPPQAARVGGLALIAIAVLACSQLPAIDRGVCGNRVVEDDEECDGTGTGNGTVCGTAGDNACHFVCGVRGEAPVCPDGFACGTDQRCRAPVGRFLNPGAASRRFDVDDFRIGDVDGDGVGDAIGATTRTIRVRLGNATTPLASELDVATRLPTGPIDFTHFAGSAALDAIVPVGVGVFSLVSSGAELDPVAYTSIPLVAGKRVMIGAAEVVHDIDSEIITIDEATIGFLGAPVALRRALPGNLSSDKLAGALQIADLNAPARGSAAATTGPDACPTHDGLDAADEIALAFAGDTSVYVYTGSGCDRELDPSNTLTVGPPTVIKLPAGTTVGEGGALFGNFDKDGCTDLLVSVDAPCAGGSCEALVLASGKPGPAAGTCAGELLGPRTIFVDSGAGRGQSFRPLAAGDFTGDGIDDLVFDAVVRRTRCGDCDAAASYGFDFLATATAPWAAALVTDINRDGRPDIAAITAGEDDVDVLLGAGDGAFNRYKVDTAGPVELIRTADFDGDLFLDLAIVETSGDASAGDVVSVSFGSAAGGPSPPVVMGALGDVLTLAAVSSVPDLESRDSVADLIVVSDRDAGKSRAAAILLGDTSRRMVAPFILRTAGDPVPDEPRAVVAGSLDGVTGVDIAVIAAPGAQADSGQDPVRAPRLWLLRGGPDSDGTIVDTRVLPLGEGGVAIGAFTPLDALYAVGELDGENPAEVIAIDRVVGGGNASAAAHLLVGRALGSVETRITALPALGGVRTLRLEDLDGDHLDEVYAIFGPRPREISTGVLPPPHVLVLWNRDGVLDAAAPEELTVPGHQCSDLVPIEIDGDADRELALLCSALVDGRLSSALFIADLDPGTGHYRPPVKAAVVGDRADPIATGGADELEVGDVDGDLVDDLVVHLGIGKSVTLLHQCTADQRGDCSEPFAEVP